MKNRLRARPPAPLSIEGCPEPDAIADKVDLGVVVVRRPMTLEVEEGRPFRL
jgi:hypothetical protein